MEGSKMSSLPGHTSYLLRGKAHSATIGPEVTEEIADDPPLPYFTGTIRCAYGVPGNMIQGPPECGSVEKNVGSSFCPGPGMNIMCGGEVTHCRPAGGWLAKGSVLLASLPPCSM